MRRLVLLLFLALVAVPAAAHEGHDHKIMGTVESRHDQHLEIKATDGKTSMVTLNDKTKVLRGKTGVKLDDIKVGERIVVMAREVKGKDGKTTLVARQINLPAATAAAK